MGNNALLKNTFKKYICLSNLYDQTSTLDKKKYLRLENKLNLYIKKKIESP